MLTVLHLVRGSAWPGLPRQVRPVKAGGDLHVGLAGLDSLVQDGGLGLEGLHKVGVSELQPAGLCVELVAPLAGVRPNPTLGTQQFSLQLLLSFLKPLDLLEPPVSVQATDGGLVVLQYRDLRARVEGGVAGLHAGALALQAETLVARTLTVRS